MSTTHKVTAIMTSTPEQSSETKQMLQQVAYQTSIAKRHFKQINSRSDSFAGESATCDPVNAAVQISPIGSVKRHSTGSNGLVTETIYAEVRSKIEIQFGAPVHLLVMYDGARDGGETSIEGLTPSRLRNFGKKLTFVPAGCAYHEWHQISMPTRITFLYLDPARFQKPSNVSAQYTPKALFEDLIVWETAAKLKGVIERSQCEGTAYSEALAGVLAHELLRLDKDLVQTSPVNRGGLASWQTRAVTSYIEEHLTERIPIIVLARLVHLSQYHFCRAFKQSFGMSPHLYLVHRRIEKGKILLADRATTVTEAGLILGYSQTSSFTVAFRKITGQTPREFRRNFMGAGMTASRPSRSSSPI
jgi:AraC family transcriptional regulator